MADWHLDIAPASQDQFQAAIARVVEVTRQPWTEPNVWRRLQQGSYDGLLSYLDATVDWRGAGAHLYSYNYAGPNLLRYMTFGFDYLMYNAHQQRCVLFNCGDMD